MASQTTSSTSVSRETKVQNYVNRQLDRTRRQVKSTEFWTHGLVVVAAVFAFLLLVSLIDAWIWPLGVASRWICLIVLLVGSIVYLTMSIGPLFLRRIHTDYAAKMIEDAQPSFKNSLLNYVSLRKKPEQTHKAVLDAVSKQAAIHLQKVPEDANVDKSGLIRIGFYLLGLIIFAAVYWMISPKSPLQSFERILAPGAKLAAPSFVQVLEVDPGDVQIFFGDTVAVSATIKGNFAEQDVQLVFSSLDGQIVDQSVVMERESETSSRFFTQLTTGQGGIQQSLVYRVVARDGVSPDYQIDVRPNPAITVESVKITPPAYTQLPTETFRGGGNVEAAEGSLLTVSAQANLPIESAIVELLYRKSDDRNGGYVTTDTVNMSVDQQTATGSFVVALTPDRTRPRMTHYRLRFTSQSGDRNQQPNIYPIQIIPDLAPEIQVLSPINNVFQLPANATHLIDARATDLDYGISSVVLEMNKKGVPLFAPNSLPLKSEQGKTRVRAQFLFDPREYFLAAGDQVVFSITANDNRTSHSSGRLAPNVAISESYTIEIVAAVENPNRDQPPQDPPQQDNQDQREQNSDEKSDNQSEQDSKKESGQGESEDSDGSDSVSDDSGEAGEQETTDAQSDVGEEGEKGSESDGRADERADQGADGSESSEQESGDQSEAGSSGSDEESSEQGADGQASNGSQGSESQSSESQGAQSGSQSSSSGGDGAESQDGANGGQKTDSGTGTETGSGSQDAESQNGTGAENASSQGGRQSGRSSESQSGVNPDGSNASAESGGQFNEGSRDPNSSRKPLDDNATPADILSRAKEFLDERDKEEAATDGNPDAQSQPTSNNSDASEENTGAGTDPDDVNNNETKGSGSTQADDFQPDQDAQGAENNVKRGDATPNGSQGEQNGTVNGASGSQTGDQSENGASSEDSETGQANEAQGREEGNSKLNSGEEGQERRSGTGASGKSTDGGAEASDRAGENGGNQKPRDPDAANKGTGGGKQPSGEKGQQPGEQGGSGQGETEQGETGQSESGNSGQPGSDSGQPGDESGQPGNESGQGNQPGQSNQQPEPTGDSQSSDSSGDSQSGSSPSGSQDSPSSQSPESGSDPSGGSAEESSGQSESGGQSEQNGQAGSSAGQSSDSASSSSGDSQSQPAQPSSSSQPSPQPPSNRSGGDGSGAGVSDEMIMEKENIENSKKTTELLLDRLKRERENPDPELLEQLNFTKEELNQFLENWEAMKRAAATGDSAAKRRYDQAIKSVLDFDSSQRQVRGKSDGKRGFQTDSAVNRPPPEISRTYRAFIRKRNRSKRSVDF